jgi:hypothetical protein
VVEPLPPTETGPVPVHFDTVTARWFGIAPAALLLALAVLGVVLAIVLFALGRWPGGLIAFGASLFLLAAFGEAAKRKPDSAIAARSIDVFRAARERAGVAVGSAAARTRAQRELARARHELLGLQQKRQTMLVDLGAATLADDGERVTALKGEIGELDRLATEKEAEMEAIQTRTREGIEAARLAVQKTMMVQIPGEEPDEDEPPAPEYPPPDEGDPPDPARIPEPYPPPEITPPEIAGEDSR